MVLKFSSESSHAKKKSLCQNGVTRSGWGSLGKRSVTISGGGGKAGPKKILNTWGGGEECEGPKRSWLNMETESAARWVSPLPNNLLKPRGRQEALRRILQVSPRRRKEN